MGILIPQVPECCRDSSLDRSALWQSSGSHFWKPSLEAIPLVLLIVSIQQFLASNPLLFNYQTGFYYLFLNLMLSKKAQVEVKYNITKQHCKEILSFLRVTTTGENTYSRRTDILKKLYGLSNLAILVPQKIECINQDTGKQQMFHSKLNKNQFLKIRTEHRETQGYALPLDLKQQEERVCYRLNVCVSSKFMVLKF